MGGRARAIGAVAGIVVVLVLALTPAPGLASTAGIIAPSDPNNPQVDSGWQAGTCKTEPPEPGAETCSVDTPDQFFERAAAHPNWGFTQFIVKHKTEGTPPLVLEKPEGELKNVRVDLPVGLSVNPGATPRCDLEVFEASAESCDANSQVGTSFVTAADPLLGAVKLPLEADVYNIKPPFGEPARFGLELLGKEIFLKADVDWSGNYHEGFTIAVPKALELPGLEGVILKNRLVFDGRSGDGTFITTPGTCLGPAAPGPSGHAYSTYLLASSYAEEETIAGYQFPQSAAPPFESPIPPGTEPRECNTIPYDPKLAVDPRTATTDSPAGAAVDVEVPHLVDPDGQDSSNTRTAEVTLPVGMGINPSAANGLKVCTEPEFGKGTRNPIACPPESKIGTATIESPPLPEGALTGNVYVAKQESRDPMSGKEYRIFVAAESARYGISVRLIGEVRADPQTGQLSTTFAENPQVPFTSFELDFDDGPRAVLSSPPICGPTTGVARMTPWSGNPPTTPSAPIVLTAAPGGGACPKTLAERPFAPNFEARPQGTKAGAFSPLALRIARGDGQQELKGLDLILAPGMSGKLAGIPYCSEAALTAAAANAGEAERAASSCPAQSQVGIASVTAGTGSAPLRIETGKVFLSGPYNGAPLSLAVVTPATAGPFDLGTVVVRVALFVEPETVQIHPVSDPIPHVFGGTQLSIRDVDVDINRKTSPSTRPAATR